MANDRDCIELGLTCAAVCTALYRGLDGKLLSDLSNSVHQAIDQLAV